jgi:predicted DCC family thiol-disulfide oxidoreductase YuxK
MIQGEAMPRETIRTLDVYYDRSCALCRGEVEALAAVAGEGALRLHDCAPADFHDDAAARDGIGRDAMLRAMHVRDADGRWHRGVDAFVVMYRAAGVENLARVWAHPSLKPLWERVYPFVARNRVALGRLGVPRLVRAVIARMARRAARNRCDARTCAR